MVGWWDGWMVGWWDGGMVGWLDGLLLQTFIGVKSSNTANMIHRKAMASGLTLSLTNCEMVSGSVGLLGGWVFLLVR